MAIYYPSYSPKKSTFRTSFPPDEAPESPQASLPRSKHARHLPVETMIMVFNEGCELDPEIEGVLVYRRMRYPLISVARMVCMRWRCIIDGYDRINKKSYWFTFLRMFPAQSGSHFAYRVLQFKQALANSQDCDIHIEFSLNQSEEIKELSTVDASLLNLFARTINFLVPYQNQIVSFRIDVNQPQFLGYLFRMFATKLNNMIRSPSVIFRNPPPPLSDIIGKQPIVLPDICANTYRTISPSRLLPRVPTISFVRRVIRQKDSFMIDPEESPKIAPHWDISWLDSKKMKFPFFVTHLEFPELSLHKSYDFFDAIRNELVTLTISSSKDSNVTQDIALLSSIKSIDFPKLQHLCMSDPSSGSGWAGHFLRNISCPQLIFAKITENGGSPLSLLEDTFDLATQIPVPPQLQELTVEAMDVSQHALSCLACLASPSVRKLRIGSLSFRGCGVSNRQRITDIFKGIFRHMHPLEIYLNQLYQHEVSLLEVFNFDVVRELTIGDISRDIRVSFFPLSSNIQAPLLSKLEISVEQLPYFVLLEIFECVSLTTLNLCIAGDIIGGLTTPVFDINDRIQPERTFTDPITSLLTALDARGESRFPNLQSLHLIMRTSSIGIDDLMQTVDKLSARQHPNGVTPLALQQIDSSEFWTQRDLRAKELSRETSLSPPRQIRWEHVVILKAAPVGIIQPRPKQSRRMVLADKHFNLIDQIDFNDAYQIAQRDPKHWVTQAILHRSPKGNIEELELDNMY